MPNPYDDIFNPDGNREKGEKKSPIDFGASDFGQEDYPTPDKDSLDEILDSIKFFTKEAEGFSQLLSRMRAIDHKDEGSVLRYFLVSEDKHDKKSLSGERRYRNLLTVKFEKIIVPMRDLAKLHFNTVQQFNRDIDKHYYSFDKSDRIVKSDKEQAINGINLQRKILADAESSLEILHKGLMGTERRIKKYINVGGMNNISSSEYEIIVQKRENLTSGRKHHFDYSFFNVNLLDKTATSLGIYMKETTSQYLGKLEDAFELM
jgi:hypothetical protein